MLQLLGISSPIGALSLDPTGGWTSLPDPVLSTPFPSKKHQLQHCSVHVKQLAIDVEFHFVVHASPFVTLTSRGSSWGGTVTPGWVIVLIPRALTVTRRDTASDDSQQLTPPHSLFYI